MRGIAEVIMRLIDIVPELEVMAYFFDRSDRDQVILNDPNDRYRDPGCGLWDRSLGLGRGDFGRS